MRLVKVLVTTGLARSRGEAERLIKGNAVSVGGCSLTCSFFEIGKCDCGGWRRVTNPAEEVTGKVKVGNGLWRLLKRMDGQPGYEQVNGIAAVPVQSTEAK